MAVIADFIISIEILDIFLIIAVNLLDTVFELDAPNEAIFFIVLLERLQSGNLKISEFDCHIVPFAIIVLVFDAPGVSFDFFRFKFLFAVLDEFVVEEIDLLVELINLAGRNRFLHI